MPAVVSFLQLQMLPLRYLHAKQLIAFLFVVAYLYIQTPMCVLHFMHVLSAFIASISCLCICSSVSISTMFLSLCRIVLVNRASYCLMIGVYAICIYEKVLAFVRFVTSASM